MERIDYAARCDRCPFEAINVMLTNVSGAANVHEVGNAGHRVTVWDGPTSQLPRSFWATDRTDGAEVHRVTYCHSVITRPGQGWCCEKCDADKIDAFVWGEWEGRQA